MSFNHPYLDLKQMEMLRRVRLKPRGRAEGTFAGPHASPYRGTAVEFSDYRNYAEGDDIRQVDWKVFARTDRHYVRLYEAERNLLSYVVVDASGSMAFDGVVRKTRSKLEHAARLAAAIAYLVVDAGDEAGLAVSSDRLRDYLPPASTWAQLAQLVKRLGDASAAGATDLGTCLMEVYRRVSRRGVLVVFSDFLDPSPDLWKKIDLFRGSRFDVMLFHVVHPEELELPDVPLARFTDPEGSAAFRADPAEVRDLYRERIARHLADVEAQARTRGCDWYLARTDADPHLFLKQCFLAREYRR